MTTEDDFNRALDRDPSDWQTRLVFADWLDEHGDRRARGYRALGALRLWPITYGYGRWVWVSGYVNHKPNSSMVLPSSWFKAVRSFLGLVNLQFGPDYVGVLGRRTAEDAAAMAFLSLSEAERDVILSRTP